MFLILCARQSFFMFSLISFSLFISSLKGIYKKYATFDIIKKVENLPDNIYKTRQYITEIK